MPFEINDAPKHVAKRIQCPQAQPLPTFLVAATGMPTHPRTDGAQAEDHRPNQPKSGIWRFPRRLLQLEIPSIQDRQGRPNASDCEADSECQQQPAPMSPQAGQAKVFRGIHRIFRFQGFSLVRNSSTHFVMSTSIDTFPHCLRRRLRPHA